MDWKLQTVVKVVFIFDSDHVKVIHVKIKCGFVAKQSRRDFAEKSPVISHKWKSTLRLPTFVSWYDITHPL